MEDYADLIFDLRRHDADLDCSVAADAATTIENLITLRDTFLRKGIVKDDDGTYSVRWGWGFNDTMRHKSYEDAAKAVLRELGVY